MKQIYRFDRIYIYQFHVDTDELELIEKMCKEALHLRNVKIRVHSMQADCLAVFLSRFGLA